MPILIIFLGAKLVEFVRKESFQYCGKIHLYLCYANFMGRWSQKCAGFESNFWQHGGKYKEVLKLIF